MALPFEFSQIDASVAAIGELYGVSRSLTLPFAAVALLAAVASGSCRRVERAALVIGLFEVVFFAVVWVAHPSVGAMAKDVANLPVRNTDFVYLAAAITGATFNPWMIFY